jgi:hypothetical protein
MKIYIPFAAYVVNNHFDQQDLIYLLGRVFVKMRRKKTEVFHIVHENISVRPTKDARLKFKIKGIKKQEEEIVESEKIFPFCDFIVSVIYKNSTYSLEEMYQMFFEDLYVIKELKNLVKHSYLPGSLYSFKMFASRIFELNLKIEEPNIFMYDLLIDDGVLFEDHSENKKKRVSLEICCCCRGVNLEPMYFLSECECFIHKNCFENEIIEFIEDFEINKEKGDEKIHCNNPQNHLSIEDLKVMVEIEKGKFTLSPNIILMIEFYFLNPLEDVSHFCNCNKEHKKVRHDTKRPYFLCNQICSFCGTKHISQCSKFSKSLNWSL